VIKKGLSWDVMGGVARRSWARNDNAIETSVQWNAENQGKGHITIPFSADEELIKQLLEDVSDK